ncbi:MAG: TolC family protein [Bacteroidetes bacterium]|nr:TolC family protein [Bacteroidota bacterium]
MKKISILILTLTLSISNIIHAKELSKNHLNEIKDLRNSKLSIEEAIQIALRNNIDIKESKLNENISKIDKNVKLIDSMTPSLNASAGTYGEWENDDIGNSNSKFNKKSRSIIKGTLKWDMMSIPRKIAKYKISKQQYQLLKARKEEIIEKKLYEIIDNYYNVVINQKKYKVLKKSLNLSEEKLDILKKRFKTGEVAKSDLLQSQIEYNESHSRLMEQEQNLILSKFELYKLLGIKEDIEVIEEIPQTKDILWEKIYQDFLKNNHKIKVIKLNTLLLKSEDEKNGLKAYIPNLFTFVQYDVAKKNNIENTNWENPVSRFSIGMGVNFDLSKIIKSTSKKKASYAKLKLTKLKQNIEIEKLKAHLKNNFEIYKHFKKRILLGQKNLESTNKNLQMQIKNFNNGNIKLIELHIAMHKEREANLNLLNNIYYAKKYETMLRQMMGRLSEDYINKK